MASNCYDLAEKHGVCEVVTPEGRFYKVLPSHLYYDLLLSAAEARNRQPRRRTPRRQPTVRDISADVAHQVRQLLGVELVKAEGHYRVRELLIDLRHRAERTGLELPDDDAVLADLLPVLVALASRGPQHISTFIPFEGQ